MGQVTPRPVIPEFPRIYIYAAGNFGTENHREKPISGISGLFGKGGKKPVLFSGTKVTNGLDYLIGRASA